MENPLDLGRMEGHGPAFSKANSLTSGPALDLQDALEIDDHVLPWNRTTAPRLRPGRRWTRLALVNQNKVSNIRSKSSIRLGKETPLIAYPHFRFRSSEDSFQTRVHLRHFLFLS